MLHNSSGQPFFEIYYRACIFLIQKLKIRSQLNFFWIFIVANDRFNSKGWLPAWRILCLRALKRTWRLRTFTRTHFHHTAHSSACSFLSHQLLNFHKEGNIKNKCEKNVENPTSQLFVVSQKWVYHLRQHEGWLISRN